MSSFPKTYPSPVLNRQADRFAPKIWQIEDALRAQKDNRTWSRDQFLDAEKLLNDHKLEVFMRMSKNPGVDGGGKGAHPAQLEMRRKFFTDKPRKRIYAASGANQCGKTQGISGIWCEHLRDDAKDGACYWIIAKTTQTMRDIPLKQMWELLPQSMFGEQVYNPKTGFGLNKTILLTLPNNRGVVEVWLWTEEMDLGVIESARLDGIWWTECTREALLSALQPRMAAKSGFMLMDYVPRLAWHKLKIRIPSEQPKADVYHQRYRMIDNQHNLGPGEIKRQRAVMSKKEAAIRIDGEEGSSFGVVYPEFDPDLHVCKPFKIPKDWPRWRVVDFGFSDPTVCLWFALSPNETAYVYREHYVRSQGVKYHANMIKEKSAGEVYVKTEIDPAATQRSAGNEITVIEQYTQHGIRMTPATRTQKFGMHAGVERVRRRFEENSIKFFSTCENTIREAQIWKYREDKDGNPVVGDVYENGNDHTLDCVRYWLSGNPTHTVAKIKTDSNRKESGTCLIT